MSDLGNVLGKCSSSTAKSGGYARSRPFKISSKFKSSPPDRVCLNEPQDVEEPQYRHTFGGCDDRTLDSSPRDVSFTWIVEEEMHIGGTRSCQTKPGEESTDKKDAKHKTEESATRNSVLNFRDESGTENPEKKLANQGEVGQTTSEDRVRTLQDLMPDSRRWKKHYRRQSGMRTGPRSEIRLPSHARKELDAAFGGNDEAWNKFLTRFGSPL